MKYESLDPVTREEAERLIRSEDSESISEALVRAVHSGHDISWSLDLVAAVATMEDEFLKRIAATCVAHLGRLRDDLDIDRAREILAGLWATGEPNVRGHVQDALDDIETFRGIKLEMDVTS